MHESSHTWVSHVTYVLHMMVSPLSPAMKTAGQNLVNHDTHMNESHHTYEWVTSHICHIWWCFPRRPLWKPRDQTECVMSHIWMSHVTQMNESCHMYKRVIVWVSHLQSSLRVVGLARFTMGKKKNHLASIMGTAINAMNRGARTFYKYKPKKHQTMHITSLMGPANQCF